MSNYLEFNKPHFMSFVLLSLPLHLYLTLAVTNMNKKIEKTLIIQKENNQITYLLNRSQLLC